MRVFLDANILFSVALPKSRTGCLLGVAKSNAILLTNSYAAEEARRNLSLKRADSLSALEKLISECELVGEMHMSLSAGIASKDRPILEGAIAGNASHLLTGDESDFGIWFGKTVQGVTIVSPRMFAIELKRKKWMK